MEPIPIPVYNQDIDKDLIIDQPGHYIVQEDFSCRRLIISAPDVHIDGLWHTINFTAKSDAPYLERVCLLQKGITSGANIININMKASPGCVFMDARCRL